MTTSPPPTIPDYRSDAYELEKAQGFGNQSNGFWVLLSLGCIHSPFLSNSERVSEVENLLFFAQRCIGAGCEPRLSPLPGQDELGDSLAAPVQLDQVEDTPTPFHSPAAPRVHPFAAFLASRLRACREEMKASDDVFDQMVIQGRMDDICRASALYSEFLISQVGGSVE